LFSTFLKDFTPSYKGKNLIFTYTTKLHFFANKIQTQATIFRDKIFVFLQNIHKVRAKIYKNAKRAKKRSKNQQKALEM
tara:strand:+ start:342 stop:578 length:237 start_codon:yes stop_codon:yes gene_type:complete